jgi:hypothetical protein
VVTVPRGYTVRPLPVGLEEIKRQLGPSAAAFTGLLNAGLLRNGVTAGTVQMFRLTPEAAEIGDELLPEIVDGYTQGARTTSTVLAGQRVTLARNVRGSGLDVAAWRRGREVVLLAASPRYADLRAVATSIIRNQRG